MGCHDLCDSASAPSGLQSLFRGYRDSLPPLKQELVSDTILNRPRLFPGLVGYEDGEPAVAVYGDSWTLKKRWQRWICMSSPRPHRLR